MAKVHRDNGQPLEATFSVEEKDSNITIVYESAGGAQKKADARKDDYKTRQAMNKGNTRARNKDGARNADYKEGLEQILKRLAALDILISAVLLESKKAVKLPIDERLLQFDGRGYPLVIDAPDILCEQMRVAMAKLARAPGAKGSGSRERRIRLVLDIPNGRYEPAGLEQTLASGRQPRLAAPKIGTGYRTVEENVTVSQAEPFAVDPEKELEVLTTARRRGAEPVTAGSQGASAVATAEPRRSRVQGYEPDAAIRRAIEQCAMSRAEKHYREQGFEVENTAATEPYDFRCTREGLEVRVEVKGTRGDGAEIEVTIGEVLNARGDDWRTDLFVVSRIAVERTEEVPVARGGTDHLIEGWRPADGDLTPIRFRCVVPEKSG